MSVAPIRSRRVHIGPEHHGQRMSLAQFARASGAPEHDYELENGVVIVVAIPGVPHELIVQFIRDALTAYKFKRPGRIRLISGGTASVVRAWELQSERHPDVTVYLTPPPTDAEQGWDEWTPDIVIEVVSKSSHTRDYQPKSRDYLAAGVRQYWIIDPLKRVAILFSRRGDTWNRKRLASAGIVRTGLLPGFQLKLSEVWKAARLR